MTTSTYRLTITGSGPVDVIVDELGEGHPFLLLHGVPQIETPDQLMRAIFNFAGADAADRQSR